MVGFKEGLERYMRLRWAEKWGEGACRGWWIKEYLCQTDLCQPRSSPYTVSKKGIISIS